MTLVVKLFFLHCILNHTLFDSRKLLLVIKIQREKKLQELFQEHVRNFFFIVALNFCHSKIFSPDDDRSQEHPSSWQAGGQMDQRISWDKWGDCIRPRLMSMVTLSSVSLSRLSTHPSLSCDHSRPIRGQYPGHVITRSQSEIDVCGDCELHKSKTIQHGT